MRRQIIIDDELIELLDRWRAQQPGIPSRSQAIRELLRRQLDVEGTDPERQKPPHQT